jgi:predicted dehydrogenase
MNHMSVPSENPVAIGIVGAGVISEIYLQNLINRFDHTRVVGVADIIPEAARARADQFGVEAFTVDELLEHPEIELVLNLTIPAAHAEVAIRAVNNGKSAFNEKPLAISREEGKALLDAAKANGVRVGAAPDTFLGGGLQTARHVIDSGAIGEPVAASALMLGHGMESWHPNPYFFFQPGAGPLFDLGPYYLTALTSILGPVSRVSAFGRASFPERTIGSGPKKGEKIPVNTPTHIVSSLEFESGVLTQSFDVWDTNHATLVIYGTEGTLRLPDPNTFGGPIQILDRKNHSLPDDGTAKWGRRNDDKPWEDVPLTYGNTENSRGLGLADLAAGLRTGEPHRASAEMAYHVLDIMVSVLESADNGAHIAVESTMAGVDELPTIKEMP